MNRDATNRDALAYSQHQGTSVRRSAAALPQKPDLSGRCKTFSNVPIPDVRLGRLRAFLKANR
jgi:hypothetical protein